MASKNTYVLTVNMTGPDGTSLPAGAEIPSEWLKDDEFDVKQLVASGGAKKKG